MARLTVLQRAIAIGQLQAGATVRGLARRFHVSRTTIQCLSRKFAATGDVKDLPRSGRPKGTTHQQDRYIVTSSLQNWFKNGEVTFSINVNDMQ
jgi:transposase